MRTEYFDFHEVIPGTPDFINYLALRYEVFCNELGRVSECYKDGPSGQMLESDQFDLVSKHVVCRYRPTGEILACARLILPNGIYGLNIEGRYQFQKPRRLRKKQIGEISRMAISSALRRRHGDPLPVVTPSSKVFSSGLTVGSQSKLAFDRRHGPHVALGIYRELFRLSAQHGVTHAYAAMEPCLARLLIKIGFPFEIIGALNETVSPPRRPYLIGADAIRTHLASKKSCLYQYLFDNPLPNPVLAPV